MPSLLSKLCAKICFFYILVGQQLCACAGQADAPGLQHIAVIRGLQGHVGVLLDEQDGHALLVDLPDDLEDIPEYIDSDDPDCIQSDGSKEGKEISVCCEIEDLSFERIHEAYGRPECDVEQVRDIWDNLPSEERRKALAFIPRYFDVRSPQYRKRFFNFLTYQIWNQPLKDYGNRINRTDTVKDGSADDRNTAEARKAIESLLSSSCDTAAK